jgi:hypothetical protein
MPDAISIHVGAATVDPTCYRSPPPRLPGAERDAAAMAELARHAGLDPTVLVGEEATRARLVDYLAGAAARLAPGSLLVVTFAGHGVQLADAVPDPAKPRPASARNLVVDDERDRRDEAWCLRDGFVLDDELHDLLSRFAAGVRVLVCSDSCHSGTMTRLDPPEYVARSYRAADAALTYQARRAEYDARRAAIAARRSRVQASVIHLAACADDGLAFEHGGHGVFTAALLEVWDRGNFRGSHPALLQAVAARIDALQAPAITRIGPQGETHRTFQASRPFTP